MIDRSIEDEGEDDDEWIQSKQKQNVEIIEL